MSYAIQHDYLFAEPSLAYKDGFFPFVNGAPKKAVPFRLSGFLKANNPDALITLASLRCPLLLQDDLLIEENPILMDYKTLLVRAIVVAFHKRGTAVFLDRSLSLLFR